MTNAEEKVTKALALVNDLKSRIKMLVYAYGEHNSLDVTTASFDYGIELEGSTIDKIEVADCDVRFYYNANTNDYDEFDEFDYCELMDYFMELKEWLEKHEIGDDGLYH
jgi:hypothetical protein